MGMHEGRARLNKSVKELMARWNETKSQWNDGTSRAFEVKYLTPLEQDAKTAVGAMDHMAQVLQKMRSDCE